MNIWHKIPLHHVIPSAQVIEYTKDNWKEAISKKKCSQQVRETLSNALKDQYQALNCHTAVTDNIERLKENNTFSITTGQQIVTALGPWMVLHKIATAIQLAKKLSLQFPESHFVPIFWMATEDHDWQEIAEIKKGDRQLRWNNPEGGAVGRLSSITMAAELRKWNEQFPDFAFNDEIIDAYQNQMTLSSATRWLVNHIFGHHGLVVVDGDDYKLKAIAAPMFIEELAEQKLFHLAQKYGCVNGEIEIKPYNLFQLLPGKRVRVQTESEAQDLLSAGDCSAWSPNVALRIFYQETILPNIAYVGGPSEQKYWHQVSPFFADWGISKPLFLLRDRGVLIPDKWCKKWEALGWDKESLLHPMQCVHAEMLDKYGSEDVLLNLKDAIRQAYDMHYAQIASEDATLINVAKGDCVKSVQMVEQLEKKILRARKRKEDESTQFAERWSQHVMPKNHLAERWDYWIFEWQKNKHMVDVLIDQLDAEDPYFKIWSY